MAQNWIKDLVDERRARDAKARALALLAFGGADPTEAELGAFTPGRPVDPLRGVTGATATPGPAGTPDPALAADLQAALRNEELARAAEANAPAVQQLRLSQALGEAGLDETRVAQGAALRSRQPAVQAEADLETERANVVRQVLVNPEVDPLLRVDIADKKPVFKSQLVKVRRRDGTEVYMNQTPTLTGQPTYTPAVDEGGEPLAIPQAARGRGAGGETALQKNVRFLARVMFAGDPEGEQKAAEMLTQLKGKSPAEAWDSLTRFAARMDYGRHAKDPVRLYNKVAELWRVARPMEPVPADAPGLPFGGAGAAPAPATAPAPRPAALPVSTNEPTAINPQTGERLVFRNGRWQPLN